MRITNSMVTANTKSNININKIYHDKANTQVATGQRIIRPSDDPVIAIRALRLNTSYSQLTQFKQKNIPDAEAWFNTTETALTQTDQVISDIREKLNQAVSQDNNNQSVSDVLEELKQLRDQLYVTGNADDAGRTVFTGYRTSEQLTFDKSEKIRYNIYQPLSISDITTREDITGGMSFDQNSDPMDSAYDDYIEQSISKTDPPVDRIRLAYGDLMETTPKIGVLQDDGTVAELYTFTSFNATTGEIDLSSTEKTDLINGIKAAESSVPPKQVVVYYEKNEWDKGDLRPEHYFMCKTPKDATNEDTYNDKVYPDGIEYNFNRVDADGRTVTSGGTVKGFINQNIEYEIAFGQTIQINTHADDVYLHGMGRDIDELTDMMMDVENSKTKLDAISKKLEDALDGSAEKERLQQLYDAANKEYTYMQDKMHNMYQNVQDSFKNYQEILNKEISRIGAMTKRLELTKNRVEDQHQNVEELADKNINIDLDEIGLDYTSAKTALEAARLAAGQIAESTLLNYI